MRSIRFCPPVCQFVCRVCCQLHGQCLCSKVYLHAHHYVTIWEGNYPHSQALFRWPGNDAMYTLTTHNIRMKILSLAATAKGLCKLGRMHHSRVLSADFHSLSACSFEAKLEILCRLLGVHCYWARALGEFSEREFVLRQRNKRILPPTVS